MGSVKSALVKVGTCAMLVACIGCEHTYNATVKLADLIKLDSGRLCHFNSHFYTVGDIINLNPTSKTGTRVGKIAATTDPTVELDDLEVAAGNSLQVSFTGDTNALPTGDLKAQLS